MNVPSLAASISPLAAIAVGCIRQKSSVHCASGEQTSNATLQARLRALNRSADIDRRVQLRRSHNATKINVAMSGKPLFEFGIIADIQHADIRDACNFNGTEARGYRGALDVAKEAVEYWTSKDLLFVAQLGDLIDGQNAGKYGDGVYFAQPQSWNALDRVFSALCELDCSIPYLHAIGNHELYNFNPEDLASILGASGCSTSEHLPSNSPWYYSFSPHPGWRIVMLNGFENSVALPANSKGRLEAERVLKANHPHAEAVISGQGGVDYFKGLSGMQMRFVPFNGGFGQEQLGWLRRTISASRKQNERVIILSHLPLHPMSVGNARNCPYDCHEAMRIIWEEGEGCVVAYFAGHSHKGGIFSEPSVADHTNLWSPLPGEAAKWPNEAPMRAGLHHLVLEAALTHRHAYGHVEVYPDRLEIVGLAPVGMSVSEVRKSGFIPSRTLPLERPLRDSSL